MFKLSENIDPNKVFIVNRSELERRIDPHFHKKEYNIIKEKLSLIPTSSIRNESVKIFSGITPLSGGDAYTDKDNGIPFVRSGDFLEDNIIDFNNLNFIKPEIHNKLMKGSKILRNDLLIAIVGATIGKVGVYNYDFEANINQAICAVRFKENINPHFIHIFFLTDLGQKILDRIKRPVARANINLEEVGSISIPLLDIITQKKIVSYFYNKIIQKQQKEAEAQRLLDSIDDYLLGELGITLPKEDEYLPQNTDKNNIYNLDNDNPLVKKGRLFLTNLSEVTGKRIDPDYNSKYFYCLFQSLNNSIYPFERIKKYLKAIKTGTTPNQKLNAFTTEKEIPFLRNTNLKKYEINIENTKYIRTKYKDFLTFSYKDEVIMCIAGTIGISSVNIYDIPISINQNVSSLRFSEEINPFFISYWFNTNIFLSLAKRASSVATILYLNNDNLKSLPIPIPPLQKQSEIATHISQIRNKANILKQEGKEILEQAKQEVEQMILGN